MAKNVTLAQLRTDARLYADQRHGGATPFISDPELNRLLNSKLAELYDKLVDAGGHEYYASESTVSVVASTSTYTLPSDFYRMISVVAEWSSNDFQELDDLSSVSHAPDYQNFGNWGSGGLQGYRLRAGNIRLYPTPTKATTLRLQYVPACPTFALDADTFDGVNGWEKLVTLGTALEMRIIEQNDFADIAGLYAEQLERVDALAAKRDNHPKRVVEVYPEQRDDRLYWIPRSRVT